MLIKPYRRSKNESRPSRARGLKLNRTWSLSMFAASVAPLAGARVET